MMSRDESLGGFKDGLEKAKEGARQRICEDGERASGDLQALTRTNLDIGRFSVLLGCVSPNLLGEAWRRYLELLPVQLIFKPRGDLRKVGEMDCLRSRPIKSGRSKLQTEEEGRQWRRLWMQWLASDLFLQLLRSLRVRDVLKRSRLCSRYSYRLVFDALLPQSRAEGRVAAWPVMEAALLPETFTVPDSHFQGAPLAQRASEMHRAG